MTRLYPSVHVYYYFSIRALLTSLAHTRVQFFTKGAKLDKFEIVGLGEFVRLGGCSIDIHHSSEFGG